MSQISLYVMQQAIADLLLLEDFTPLDPTPEERKAIDDARRYLGLSLPRIGLLKLIFDLVNLPNIQQEINFQNPNSSSTRSTPLNHYVPLKEITCTPNAYPIIPYPILEGDFVPTLPANSLQEYLQRIATEIRLNDENWQDLNFLLFIVEKYGSCISYGDDYCSLCDTVRITAAVAEALLKNQALNQQDVNSQKVYLVAGSLSGIQDFIYTIASDGALKSLRARSFYLELVAEEIVRRLLEELKLPRTSLIYAGGGKLFLLAGGSGDELKQKVKDLQNSFNTWLFNKFQGKIFFALDCASCDAQDIGSFEFRKCWEEAIANLATQKSQKFVNQISDVIQRRNSHLPCKVCHRDDVQNLKPLNKREPESSPPACKTCRSMFKLGDKLPNTLVILRTHLLKYSADGKATHDLGINGFYYYLFENRSEINITIDSETDTIYAINNWKIEEYAQGQVLSMLMGRYYQPTEDCKFTTAEELAEVAQGIDRVGYLRMDVDRLGQIFAKGLDDHNYSLPRVASLSRQMSYFFKVYLNSLASDRANNLPEKAKTLTSKIDRNSSRKNLMFIYAGGDDLFISGAWNEIIEFALDIYQSFRAYSGNNPDITISGGISIEGAKFPLYQAATSSGNAEEKAKGNGRDSLGLFGEAFKWEEWLGYENIEPKDIKALQKEIQQTKDNKTKIIDYINKHDSLDLFGVLPFAKAILELLRSEAQASRSFTRNLLSTAQIQEQKIKELEDKPSIKQYDKQEDIRYFLHLPKIAYTLARLPDSVQKHDSFSKISTSLKSPYNAPYFRAIATWIELLNRLNHADS